MLIVLGGPLLSVAFHTLRNCLRCLIHHISLCSYSFLRTFGAFGVLFFWGHGIWHLTSFIDDTHRCFLFWGPRTLLGHYFSFSDFWRSILVAAILDFGGILQGTIRLSFFVCALRGDTISALNSRLWLCKVLKCLFVGEKSQLSGNDGLQRPCFGL